MTQLTLAIYDLEENVRTALMGEAKERRALHTTDESSVDLAMRNFYYEEGDVITITTDYRDVYLMVKLDETLDSSLVYLPSGKWTYHISNQRNMLAARPEGRFQGSSHYVSVRLATSEEVSMYRNLALNSHDQKTFTGAYPHAYANVETRNDATFFACNAIDGIFANHSHGAYPFQSWGINQQQDARLTIEFGRMVELDKVSFTWRADFPHDNYWTQVSLIFSDGSKEIFKTEKTAKRQYFSFHKRIVTKVEFTELIQSDELSPFPALTQLELFGRNADLID